MSEIEMQRAKKRENSEGSTKDLKRKKEEWKLTAWRV